MAQGGFDDCVVTRGTNTAVAVCRPVETSSDDSLGTAVVIVAWFAVTVAVATFVANDMRRRGHSGVVWAIVVFLTGPIGVVLWLATRNDHPRLPEKPAPASPYGPDVRPGSLPWGDWQSGRNG